MTEWNSSPHRSYFSCCGHAVMARQTGIFYLTCFLIVGTSSLFFGFDCPYLTLNLSAVIPVVDGLIFVFVMATLLRTSFTDPGVIPRATPEEAADIEKQIELATNDAVTAGSNYFPPPRTKEVVIRGQVNKLKYCFTCKIFRPPRASHCSVCDVCIERFDHHCPWVGNCVGLRNYRYFYLFLVSLSVHCVFMFACVLTHLILLSQQDDFVAAMKKSPASIVEAVICFFSIWSILGLAGFHTYLSVSNQTTNEDIKGTYSTRHGQETYNPYSYGSLLENCCSVVCGPLPPSLLSKVPAVAEDGRQDDKRQNNSRQHSPDAKMAAMELNVMNVRKEDYGTTGITLQQHLVSNTDMDCQLPEDDDSSTDHPAENDDVP